MSRAEPLNQDETGGLPMPMGRREICERIMYETGFDLEVVTDRLKNEFAVEQKLPPTIALCLEHLRRREQGEA